MLRQLESWLAKLTPLGISMAICLTTVGLEVLTLLLRFGFRLESTRDTGFIGDWTLGIRIHHGYVGLVVLFAAWLWPQPKSWRNLLIIVGASLLLSDLIHHFLVLWPITGSPEFDLVYPASNVLQEATNPGE